MNRSKTKFYQQMIEMTSFGHDDTTIRRVSMSIIWWHYWKIANMLKSIDFANFSIAKKSKYDPSMIPQKNDGDAHPQACKVWRSGL